MTGYESKRAAAQDKLLEDDDALTIAYQSGYYDGKKAAQPAQEPTTGNILMDSYKAMQSMKVEGPHHVVCQCDRCKQPAQEPVAWRYRGNLHEFDPSDWATGPVTPLYTAPPQRTVQVSPLEFVEMVMDKEHLVGNPIVWAQWPNKEKNT